MHSRRLVVATSLALALSTHAWAADGPTDPQIAAIVVTANQVDIDAGKLAESKGSNAEVKAFGKPMVTDHSGVNKQAVAFVTKLKVTPEDNATSKSLKAGGADNVKKLEKPSGAAFDRAYVDHEVAYHEQVLDAIDKDAHPERAERRAQELAGCGPAGLRGSPRTRQKHAGDACEEDLISAGAARSSAHLARASLPAQRCSSCRPSPLQPIHRARTRS